MRQGQARQVDELVVIEQQVEIQRTWAIALGTDAPEALLDFEQGIEQGFRGQRGFQFSHGIDELRLLGDANRSRAIERRAMHNAAFRQVGQGGKGCPHRGCRVTEIGAEGDVGGTHALAGATELAGFLRRRRFFLSPACSGSSISARLSPSTFWKRVHQSAISMSISPAWPRSTRKS